VIRPKPATSSVSSFNKFGAVIRYPRSGIKVTRMWIQPRDERVPVIIKCSVGAGLLSISFESAGDKRPSYRAAPTAASSQPSHSAGAPVATQLLVDRRIRCIFARPHAIRSPCTVAERWADFSGDCPKRSIVERVPKFLESFADRGAEPNSTSKKIHALPGRSSELTAPFFRRPSTIILQKTFPARSG